MTDTELEALRQRAQWKHDNAGWRYLKAQSDYQRALIRRAREASALRGEG